MVSKTVQEIEKGREILIVWVKENKDLKYGGWKI